MRFQFSCLLKSKKMQTKSVKHISIVFSFCPELWINCTPLIWYEQKYLKYKAHFEALLRTPCSLRLSALKVMSVCQSYDSVYLLTDLTYSSAVRPTESLDLLNYRRPFFQYRRSPSLNLHLLLHRFQYISTTSM